MKARQDRSRSVLIFGGAGFIGSNWAHRLLETTDAKVHIFDNLSRPGVRHNLQTLQAAAGASSRLQITVGDVRDAEMVQRAVRFATEIYHFAAQVAVTTSVADPRLDFEVNLLGTFNILEAARLSGQRPFMLFTSTNKVYGELQGRAPAPVNEEQRLDFHSPYGCSKGAAGQYWRDYARIYGLPTVVFRMSCICGPRQFGTEDQGWVAHFLHSALQGEPIVLYGDGLQVRDVLYVDDLLRAIEGARERQAETAGQIYNVGGGEANAVSLLELLREIERLTGERMQYVRQEARPGDQRVYVTDYGKLERATGWRPRVSPQQALRHMYGWWKANREVFVATLSQPGLDLTLEELPRTA